MKDYQTFRYVLLLSPMVTVPSLSRPVRSMLAAKLFQRYTERPAKTTGIHIERRATVGKSRQDWTSSPLSSYGSYYMFIPAYKEISLPSELSKAVKWILDVLVATGKQPLRHLGPSEFEFKEVHCKSIKQQTTYNLSTLLTDNTDKTTLGGEVPVLT